MVWGDCVASFWQKPCGLAFTTLAFHEIRIMPQDKFFLTWSRAYGLAGLCRNKSSKTSVE